MGAWDEDGILIDASLVSPDGSDSVSFPVGRRTVSGGRRGAARKYPFRNGQDYEDVGQEPRVYAYTVPLFENVDPSHYPQTYIRLIEFIENDAYLGQADLIDPEHGSVRVRMKPYTWETDPAKRNGGTLQLRFETVGEDLALFRDDALYTPTATADMSAAAMDESMAEAGVDEAALEESFDAAEVPFTANERASGQASGSFVSLLSGFNSSMSLPRPSTDVASTVDVMRRRIEAAMNMPQFAGAEAGWRMRSSAEMLMAAVTDIGQRAFRESPRVADMHIGAPISIYELSVELFGTIERAEELIQLNPGMGNFVPAGATITFPLR